MEVSILKAIPSSWSDPVLSHGEAATLLSQPHHVLLVVGEGATGGHLLARLMPHTPADILTLYVPQSHRRLGHAKALVEATLSAARAAACTALTLEVDATNAAAINLYNVCGLQQVATRANYYHDPVSNLKADALVLSVRLT